MADNFQHDIVTVQNIEAVPRILDIVCSMTGMGFAAVARVTGERWVALAVRDAIQFGLTPGGELKVETTICSEIRDAGEPVVIDHVDQDAVYCSHPTPKMYGFQSYVSVPIVLANGRFFGTLCAIDPSPRRLNTPEITGVFKLFAELIGHHLDAAERLVASEADLLDERRSAELREQFIAVLGHDLRNPLASIDSGARILLKKETDEQAITILRLMHSSVRRMAGLIDNVLDFARGRMGGGLSISSDAKEPLTPLLEQVVGELKGSSPDRVIAVDIDLRENVTCDRHRIGQLLSNLVGNALTYGQIGAPIKVKAQTRDGMIEISVANSGNPIPEAALKKLFQPFTRGAAQKDQQGLGLGLYISSEIAKAHGGTLDVTSTANETRFTFRMPYVPAAT
jgi:signal transduction histidine kinase